MKQTATDISWKIMPTSCFLAMVIIGVFPLTIIGNILTAGTELA
jgi:hypothetical protein